MLIKYSIIFLLGFLFSILFIVLFRKISLKNKLINRQGIPLIGGICIFLSFIFVCLLGFKIFGILSSYATGIIISSAVMLLFGLIDDYCELSIITKFFIQIVSTSLLIFFGIRTYIIYIGNLPNIVITFIWVIGITNAFNLLDVIDGLSASVAVIISIAFFIISIFTGNTTSAILILSLSGAIIGFLIYNLPPARIYMGNSGSHFLGFIFAAIAMLISYAPLKREIALFTPLLILGLPIFDTLFIILIRISKKKLPFEKTNDHLPLRLLALGYSKRKVLLIMLSLCLFFSVCGILVSRLSNSAGIAIIIFVIAVSWAFTKKMSKIK